MDALGNIKPEDVETMSLSTLTFDYYIQMEDFIDGDYKYAIVNYAKPTNLGQFIEENKTLWKPFHENNIKNASSMTACRMASVIYPSGNQDRFTAFTYDGFNKLSDAMKYMSYNTPSDDNPFAEVMSKSKMNEIMPDGFNYRIIYELVMAVE